MIKPRYVSVNRIPGDLRGFFFAAAWLAYIVACPFVSHGQVVRTEPMGTWILVFGNDTIAFNRSLPLVNVHEDLYEEAWRHGYFRSDLITTNIRGDSLVAEFAHSARYKWSESPLGWLNDSSHLEKFNGCELAGRWFEMKDLEVCVALNVQTLATLGYLNAISSLDSLIIDHGAMSVSAELSVSVGDIARLSDVAWVGLTKTGSNWLERAGGLQTGMVLSDANIRRASGRLYQTKLFEGNLHPEIFLNGETWGLLYTVNERPTTFFDLLIGYVPDVSGKSVIAGTGLLQVKNAGFDGTDLKLDFDRQAPSVGRLLIAIDQNMLLGLPLGVSGSFSLVRQDTLWQNRIASLGAWWDVHDNMRVRMALNRDISAAAVSNQGSANLRGTYGQIGITFDTRSDLDPSSGGLMIDLVAESGRQIVVPSAGERYNHIRKRLKGHLDIHIPLNPRNVFIPGITAGTMVTERTPFLNDLWRIGGTKSLRGYSEDQFFARSYLWGNIEYRFLLDPHSYLFAFGSSGWLWLPIIDQIHSFERKDVGSFGFGLAYNTNLGLLKFTYAKSPEDPFSNAKVHIGISSGI
jgi:translocation and assembly module TamA